MTLLRKLKPSTFFRCLVVPTMFLCAIFKHPAFQWIAVAALATWLAASLATPIGNAVQRSKHRKKTEELAKLRDEAPKEPAKPTPDSELFLIRQINFRITEQLKDTYPMVSWLWVKRPSSDELCKGGVWRIRVSNTEPFNLGEVTITKSGKLSINMIQATQLKDATKLSLESSDLEEDEIIERVDVKTWYQDEGEKIISRMIDDLNAQGHRKLTIRENGEAYITASGKEETVEQIQHFPPRLAWDEFCQVLKEDEITAAVKPEGLLLSW